MNEEVKKKLGKGKIQEQEKEEHKQIFNKPISNSFYQLLICHFFW